MPLSQPHLLAFHAITGFIKDLASVFAQSHHSLALYARFIEHMNLSQEVPIKKIVSTFTSYIAKNQTAIETCDKTKLTNDRIEYSPKVHFTLSVLFAQADNETCEVMWKHLLTIYGILFPDSQAKEILKTINSKVKTPEAMLIQDMVEKIVPHLNTEDANPMQSIMGLMTSGVFSELMTSMQNGMNDGKVDMKSLMGQMTSMFAQDEPPRVIKEKMND